MAKYYVTLNSKMLAVAAVAANDATVYTVTFSPAGLAQGGLYRVVIRGVNSAGLSVATVFVVEAHLSGQLNILHEACPTSRICQRQYQSDVSTGNGCTPAYGNSPQAARSCMCTLLVDYCLNPVVDRATVPGDAYDNLQIAVNDGFQFGVDIDYQPFVNVLGATWQVP